LPEEMLQFSGGKIRLFFCRSEPSGEICKFANFSGQQPGDSVQPYQEKIMFYGVVVQPYGEKNKLSRMIVQPYGEICKFDGETVQPSGESI
jgi:hypothetical protein